MANVAEKTLAAPATHKQPSRKGKKAWRKNVDITELQEGVDDVREQIIQGFVRSCSQTAFQHANLAAVVS